MDKRKSIHGRKKTFSANSKQNIAFDYNNIGNGHK